MKKILFCIAITAISASAKAQSDSTPSVKSSYESDNKISGTSDYTGTSDYKKTNWSIAVNPSMPIGHFKSYSGFGIGGYLGLENRPSKNFGLTLNLGYIDYMGKTVNGFKYSDFKYIPLLGGAKYYLAGNFYMHGEAGAGFGTSGLGTSFWY